MKQNIASFKIRGMIRDVNNSDISQVSKDNSTHLYAYENMNMRINAVDDNTQFALTNEKGTMPIDNIVGLPDNIQGTPIGQNVLNDTITLFTTDEQFKVPNISYSEHIVNIIPQRRDIVINFGYKKDRIYKLWFDNTVLKGSLLYVGDLKFNIENPIDTVSFYENDDLKKVYWIDGLNQPRVINIEAANETMLKWNDNSFDFVRKLSLKETVSIERNLISEGYFNPGTIQYCFTYFNKYGQESNIFHTSPLYYTSYIDRGTPANEKVSNSFDITIDNVSFDFDYIRIYSIMRTAENTVPECSIVADLFIDTSISPSNLGSTYNIPNRVDSIKIKISNDDTIYNIDNIPLGSNISKNVTTNSVRYIFKNNTFEKAWFDLDEVYVDKGDYVILTLLNNNYVAISIYRFVPGMGPVQYIDEHTPTNLKGIIYGRKTIIYNDNGLHNQTIDPTELLYVGGEEIVANTFDYKDNTLFLGDIELKKHTVGNLIAPISNITIREKLRNKQDSVVFAADKAIPTWTMGGHYSNDNQLKYNARQIKTFKYMEYYRFGIQFQYNNGSWSEPLWICDKQNTRHILSEYVREENTFLVTAHTHIYDLLDDSDIAMLKSNGFVKIRPVIVYPKLEEREVLCQGYLCPTVFNYADRYHKYCYAQSSWFARPVVTLPKTNSRNDYIQKANDVPYSNSGWDEQHKFKKGYSGRPLEYRHNFPLPVNQSFSAELQNIKFTKPPKLDNDNIENFLSEYSGYYAVDNNIVTMHSPDIELLYNTDLSKCKLRIIGMVPLTASVGNISIMTDTAGIVSYDGHWNTTDITIDSFKASTVFNPNFALDNTTINGANILGAGTYYTGMFYADNAEDQIDNIGLYHIDGSTGSEDLAESQRDGEHYWQGTSNRISRLTTANGFVIYPWHRTGSLTNQCNGTPVIAKLKEKKLSNLRYSYNTFYFDNSWSPTEGLDDCQIYNSDEVMPIKIKTTVNTKQQSVLYKGNIDSIVTTKTDYPICAVRGLKKYIGAIVPVSVNLFSSDFESMSGISPRTGNDSNKYMTLHRYGSSPISVKYKSTPHIVLSLKNSIVGEKTTQNILPALEFPFVPASTAETNENYYGYSSEANYIGNFNYFWDDSINYIKQDYLNPTNLTTGIGGTLGRHLYGFLWLGEIYRDNIENRFGGQTEEAFELNKWLPCGDAVDLSTDSEIIWSEGDTYYQRYDNLKTYPFTENDENSIIDIISFMCETRINIDGRTDRNRGNTDNISVRPTNFNLINKAYTQNDNFFTYNYINSNRINLDNFHNVITWTKTKIAGDLIDTWTNITMASVLDLDGDRGSVVSIKRLGNNIYALQDKAVCVIKFNENVAINTANGTPIELANSGKVLGKEYLSTEIGCDNKWSVCRSDNKLFFIDGNHSDIYALAGNQFVNLTAQFGFSSFIDSELENSGSWNPVSFDNFITYYDKINHDVFFINKDKCLAFNEVLNSFTSFYNYNNTPYFANIGNRGMFVNKSYNNAKYKPWMYEEGNYNQFFDEYKPYYTQIVVNDYPQTNKIFDVIEYRADAFDTQYDDLFTFDYIKTKNEYQDNDVDLTYSRHHSSNLKKKFRTWRATLPRDYSHRRDRMQNLWLNIEIGRRNFEELSKKHILYDMNVSYYI